MPELKKNILNFGYGVNFKYEGMLSHSFDRFYIVTKFELPKTKDLKLATFGFDFECSYANHTSTSTTDYARLMNYCMKIAPYALSFISFHQQSGVLLHQGTTFKEPLSFLLQCAIPQLRRKVKCTQNPK